jgi:hydrogenase maturation protease
VKLLIAGIGNIFFGDDAFGVEVVRRLATRPLPQEVTVKDFGIRGFDLACAMQAGYETVILVDALDCGSPPGTLHVLEPDIQARDSVLESAMEMHRLEPAQVIRLVQRMGGSLPRLRVVGCEPATLEPTALGALSDVVEAAVEKALTLIETLAWEWLSEQDPAKGQLHTDQRELRPQN